jgi:hypothetical protein
MADASAVPILDFSVLSDNTRPADPRPGFIETVWRFEGEADGTWQPGEELGEVHIHETGKKRFVAHFTFDKVTDRYRPVTVKGDVPSTDGRSWVGKGRARAASDGREKDVVVESRNPKKWG